MKNHTIPKSVIKRFADDTGHIWYYRKSKNIDDQIIRCVSYAGIFLLHDIYDDLTENLLQELDGKVAGIMNRIEQESPEHVVFSSVDNFILCKYIAIQLLRSEKSFREMTSNVYIDGYMHHTHNLIRPTKNQFHEQGLIFLRQMINGGVRDWVDPLRPELGQLGIGDIQIIVIPETAKASFVIGDSIPILYMRKPSNTFPQYNNKFIDPNCIKILPVNPKIAIALCKKNTFSNVPLNKLIEAINITMFNECLGIAAQDRDSIDSLLSSTHSSKTQNDTLKSNCYFCLED